MTTDNPNPSIEWCGCGEKLIADGHAQDWRSSTTLVLNNHIAEAILSHIEAEKREAYERGQRDKADEIIAKLGVWKASQLKEKA